MRFMAAMVVVLSQVWLCAAQPPLAGEIVGTVEGPDGPLADTVLTLVGPASTSEARTDAQGRFRFAAVAPGRYRLTVVATDLQSSRDVVVQSGTPLEISLKLMPAFTDTSIVTASRDLESLLNAPASVSVVENSQIESSASDTIPGLLQGVPGLNVIQFGARDINVNARGASGVLSNAM